MSPSGSFVSRNSVQSSRDYGSKADLHAGYKPGFSSASSSRPSSPTRGRGGAAPFGTDIVEDDFDELHDFRGPKNARSEMRTPFRLDSIRGYLNAAALVALAMALLGIFLVWPVTSAVSSRSIGARTAGYNLGGVNATGQYPVVNLPSLIDPDTPQDAMTKIGHDGNEWELKFSDEFNKDGRTFFPGDDPVWEGMDIHYWGTK